MISGRVARSNAFPLSIPPKHEPSRSCSSIGFVHHCVGSQRLSRDAHLCVEVPVGRQSRHSRSVLVCGRVRGKVSRNRQSVRNDVLPVSPRMAHPPCGPNLPTSDLPYPSIRTIRAANLRLHHPYPSERRIALAEIGLEVLVVIEPTITAASSLTYRRSIRRRHTRSVLRQPSTTRPRRRVVRHTLQILR